MAATAAAAEGEVRHVLLARFKDDVTSERREQLILEYAGLFQLIEPMKSFHWGTDVSAENLHQGFTHVFESTFENVEAIAEYVAHPAHVEAATKFLAALEKVIVVDYKPIHVNLADKKPIHVNLPPSLRTICLAVLS